LANEHLRIGAALFNGDHGRLADELARLDDAGVDFVHLDVFDGTLVPDLAFAPRTIAALRPLTRLPFEIHLVTTDPLRLLGPLADAGADLVLFHVEGAPMVYETVFAIRERGLRPGLALGLGAPLPWVGPSLELVDAVLLLSRVTGEGTRGATFDPRVLARVREARALVDAAQATVELQGAGGVNRDNVPDLLAAGIDTVALGAGLYRVPDLAAEVRFLRKLPAGMR
jgi:ribulose-phosphate 3-epimerase